MNNTIEGKDVIEGDRREIDGLDARIIELLGLRARVSARIQRNRISAGGPRTVLAREAEVLDRYQNGLGATGTPIALHVLKLCRGAGPVDTNRPRAAGAMGEAL
ncbi:chorismate mutase [Streptomyces sp. NPDC058622]|uniref:chorismate mutase n=1 Tax=Streptomyces sp. NPDC058622 TaxID=3346562 RepID=UPI003664D687